MAVVWALLIAAALAATVLAMDRRRRFMVLWRRMNYGNGRMPSRRQLARIEKLRRERVAPDLKDVQPAYAWVAAEMIAELEERPRRREQMRFSRS